MAELHYTRAGEGPPLLILHGLFGSSRNWQSLARRYAEHFDVVCVDLRNHGQSFHAETMNYPVMAEDVARLAAALDLVDLRMIGHSMGGKVAMTLVHDQPGLIERLVVADIAPVEYTHEYDDLLNAVLALDLAQFDSRAAIDNALAAAIPDQGLRAFLLHNLARDGEAWQWRVNWAAIRRQIGELTGFDSFAADWHSGLSVQFLRGSDSDYVNGATFETIRRHFPAAQIDTVSEAGHWLHAERPNEFMRLSLDFLLQ